ncbi:DUF4249 family protein [Leptobacterium flavescens]|uniref:DUF4249 family protein n=1 Tax=Leptobacterium flavescens TaxID=472055 RepID=A0A6P0UNN9_9FLAO|nr:DUF4249 family protein [Leptobacterium flavescens]NER13469.1 DUF4249 family protein [Leptobacterium flavescens]
MKKSYIKTVLSCTLFSLFLSCTETVDVTVPNGGDRLVVEASIMWEKGTSGQDQSVKLSKSTEFFASDLDIAVTGASVVIINNDTGDQFVFDEQGNGIYSTDGFIPVIDVSYTMEIIYDGNTYQATETLASVTEITSIEQNEVSGFDGDEISVTLFYEDPQGERNFYLAEFIPSNSPLLGLEPSDDEFYNGNETFIEYDDGNLAVGDAVDISLQGISQNFFNYIELLTSQIGEDGPFQTTPARLKGNCININDPDEEVLGYFRLSEVDRANFVIN